MDFGGMLKKAMRKIRQELFKRGFDKEDLL